MSVPSEGRATYCAVARFFRGSSGLPSKGDYRLLGRRAVIATKKELHMKFLQTVAAGLAVKALWVLFTNINWILLVPIVTDESVVQFMMV